MLDKEVELLFSKQTDSLVRESKEKTVRRQLLYVDGVLVAAISDKKAIDYLDERVDVHTG